MSAWKERAWEKGSMTNRDWGEWGGIHGRGIKFSRHWERHCDGHKPPDLLLGVCAQLRWCRRRKPPDKTWPDWMQDLDVSRATWGAAAGAGLLHSKKQQPRLDAWNANLFSKGKTSIISLSDLHQPLSSSALANGWHEYGWATWTTWKRSSGRSAAWAQQYHFWSPPFSSWLYATREKLESWVQNPKGKQLKKK